MPHHQHTKPIDPYLAQPAINKRKKVTQACDRCRQRKAVCDGLRPECRRCYKDKVECTYAPLSYKRGPRIKPRMADSEPAFATSHYPDNKNYSADATMDPSRSSAYKLLASTDPFSKEVTNHLVEVFFEHNFQDYNFFSPVIFLQQYTRGTVSPDLLNAICAVAARYSDHPAVVQTPPYSSGQVYVDRVRARMMHLMSRADLEVIQILMLLANADYCSGRFARGYRMEYMAAVMAQELGLHRLYGPDTTLNSEAERIALESKLRTFALCIVNDVTNSLISGLPGTFDHVMEGFHSLFNTQDWWVERIAISGKPMEPVDEYSIRILQEVLKPRRIRGGGILNHTIRLFSVAISITQFVKRMASYEKEGVLHSNKPESTTLDLALTVASPTTTTTGCFGSQDILEEYQKLDAKLEQWKAGVPREWEPANAKHMVARTDINCLQAAAAFYSLVLLLNRPFLMNACMSAINRRGTHGKHESAQGDGSSSTDSEAAIQDKVSERRLLDDRQREMCLNKCIHAADEIVTIAEKFTSDDIKYRGFTYAFSVFTSGTVYIIQRFMKEEWKRYGVVEDKLQSCHRFLVALAPYWAGAVDQNNLLLRLSAGTTTSGQSSSKSMTINLLSDVLMSTPLAPEKDVDYDDSTAISDEYQQHDDSDKVVGINSQSTMTVSQNISGRINNNNSSQEPTEYPLPQRQHVNLAHTLSPASSVPGSEQKHIPSTKENDDDVKHAFLQTGSGLGTLWLRPDKMASLEESTLLSFERLSILERYPPSSST